MFVFDTSSIIYAWDNYPVDKFPNLWNWIESEIKNQNFFIPEIAFNELNKSLDLKEWLKSRNILILKINSNILTISLGIKKSLGIVNNEYQSGVGENDIIIIATAKDADMTLVSNEKIQVTIPENLKKYKIPLVCKKHSIKCISFLDLIKKSDEIF